MNRPRLIIAGPVPPPAHGVTISTTLMLENERLRAHFDVEHLDTSDHRPGVDLGVWDLTNVKLGVQQTLDLARRTGGSRGVFYFPLSQGAGGFLRDSLLVYVASLRGWAVAAHLRGSEFDDFYARSPRLLRWWIRTTLARIDSVGVVGHSLRGVFANLVPDKRIAVVRNGTPDPTPNGETRRNDVVLFLSNLRPRKGVVQTVDAALRVVERHPTATFLFVGEWETEEFRAEVLARAAAGGDRLSFLPVADATRKRELLLTCAILVFPPTEPEGHPRVMLEGLAAGAPLITTDRGAIAETVGDAAVVLADPDPETLASHILTLLDDAALRETLGRRARTRYLEAFTQEHADTALRDWLVGLASG